MNCSKCGAQLASGERACWQCYTPVEGAAPAGSPAEVGAPPRAVAKPTAKASKPLFAVIAVVVVLALAYGGYFYYTQYMGPAGCARAYLVATASGDMAAVRNLMSTKDQQGFIGKMMAALPSVKVNTEVKAKVRMKNVKITGNTARVTASVTANTGSLRGAGGKGFSMTVDQDIVLVKEAAGWRVDVEATMNAALQKYGMSVEKLKAMSERFKRPDSFKFGGRPAGR